MSWHRAIREFKDFPNTLKEMLTAAAKNDPAAAVELGKLCVKAGDYPSAVKAFTSAYHRGNAEGAYYMGAYTLGEFVGQEDQIYNSEARKQAFAWFEIAADMGDKFALLRITSGAIEKALDMRLAANS